MLQSPRHGAGVCPRCLNVAGTAGLCRACRENEHHLAVVVPISYSVRGGALHRLISGYKRDTDRSVADAVKTLTSICDRFLADHEACVAAAAGVRDFELVTTVPSADPQRDLYHPLRRVVGQSAPSTRGRYERLLVRSSNAQAIPRVFDPARYSATRRLGGEPVLLIDDMWTSGASAESAAAALLAAGAGTVAAVVVGRHLNRDWRGNEAHLRRLFADGPDRDHCVLCAEGGPLAARPAVAQRGDGGSTSSSAELAIRRGSCP